MKITLNNRQEVFEREKMTFEDLIVDKKFTFKMLVTKKNGILVRKEDRNSTYINDGDDIIVLHLISGG